PNRNVKHVTALVCVPVNEHVRRGSDSPSVTRQVNKKVLNIHLARGLRSWPSDRKPLLRKNSREPFFAKVAEYTGGSDLPFVLPKARVARRRKDETGTESQEPRTGQLRAGREQRRQDCIAEAGNAMEIAALVDVRRGIHHLE